jgi:hypothetical protein
MCNHTDNPEIKSCLKKLDYEINIGGIFKEFNLLIIIATPLGKYLHYIRKAGNFLISNLVNIKPMLDNTVDFAQHNAE